jgi:predicted O-methyltransferase YrrM
MFKLFVSFALMACSFLIGQDDDHPIDVEVLEHYFETVPSAWKGHRAFADWLVKAIEAKEIVDLGVDYGYSTFVFAKAASQNGFGTVTGIDSFEGDGFAGVRDTYAYVTQWIEDVGFTNINLIKGYFNDVASVWTKPIDILHIDGFHSYEAVSNDYHTWSKFVRDEGVILFHDICVNNPAFGVIYFFRELEDGRKLYFVESYGLGIITKSEELFEKIKENFPHVRDYAKNPL